MNIKPKTIDSKLVTFLPLLILMHLYIIPNLLFAGSSNWNMSIKINEPSIWAFLPGTIIGILTFIIDGFLIVYFLGRKGFCRFICPWGAFLKLPNSLALFKVRKTGICTNCHACTDSCPIGIDVNYEINEYTKLDPTLPRTNNIKCPNQSCASNQTDTSIDTETSLVKEEKAKNDVIYLRYDDVNMKYIYICTCLSLLVYKISVYFDRTMW